MNKKLLEYFNADELPSSVWSGKYAQDGETTPDDMHRRMAKEFARIEEKYAYIPFSKKDQDCRDLLSEYGKTRLNLSEVDIYDLFKDFKHIIPQGSVMSQLGSKSIGSLSNCFVIGQPHDSYGGIFQKDQEQVQLMKRRGGVGQDLSTLRPKGVTTSNAAKTSTGLVSFMGRYSNSTREVAQDGRRGALMLSCDINHPDSLEFAQSKLDLTKVTGANISLKLNAEFMKAVENDEDYILRWPCDVDSDFINTGMDTESIEYNKLYEGSYIPKYRHTSVVDAVKGIYIKKIRAKEYWEQIIQAAHKVAEPGLMFWDNMVEYSPDGVYPQFKQVTTNPCSEIGMQPYDACRLIAVNLFGYVVNPFKEDAYFDFKKFYEHNYEAMRLSDDLVDLELEHIERILNKIESDPEPEEVKRVERELWEKVRSTATASRRTGLGVTGLGDTLAALGLKYDSDNGINKIEEIMIIKLSSELDCTTDMAITRGTFEGWDTHEEFYGVTDGTSNHVAGGNNPFYQFLVDKFPNQADRMYKYGRRNVSWSCIAPTGSLSIIAKAISHSNISSGLEPIFMPFYMRRKKVNPNDENSRVDFTDQNGDTWQEYPVVMGAFKDWLISQIEDSFDYSEKIEMINSMNKDQMESWFEASPWYGSTANDIDWAKRVEIQSVIQKYVTHSISSTINLPKDVSEGTVGQIYMESWKRGLKGITVYRDGSRSGVLVSNKENDSKEEFKQHDAPKRPKKLDAEIFHVTSRGERFTVVVGLFDDKPYEIFCLGGEQFRSHAKGTLEKRKQGLYTFNGIDLDFNISDEEVALSRMISTSLRHGANIKYVVEQLNKADGTIVSFSKAISRTLKKFIPDGEASTVKCSNCGSSKVIFQEGCQTCQDCGDGKCG